MMVTFDIFKEVQQKVKTNILDIFLTEETKILENFLSKKNFLTNFDGKTQKFVC